MQTSNGDPNIRSNRPVWYLLAECSLSEMMPEQGTGDELAAGFLSLPFRELGIPLEWIGNIEKTLTGFVKEALEPFKQGELELAGRIRVFCQKKMIDDAHAARTPGTDHTKQIMEPAPILDHSGTPMNGGWGYFIIERSGDYAGSPERSHPMVDLYLYKEGE